MPTNFGQCYVKHFYRSKNLSGMGILVENFKAINQSRIKLVRAPRKCCQNVISY